MKTKILLISAAIIIMAMYWIANFDRAFAQEATSTPTWEPLYKTPTPKPPEDYGCNDGGLPGGWGQVTPDTWWYANCAHCLLTATPHEATQAVTPTPTQAVEPYMIRTMHDEFSGYGGLDPIDYYPPDYVDEEFHSVGGSGWKTKSAQYCPMDNGTCDEYKGAHDVGLYGRITQCSLAWHNGWSVDMGVQLQLRTDAFAQTLLWSDVIGCEGGTAGSCTWEVGEFEYSKTQIVDGRLEYSVLMTNWGTIDDAVCHVEWSMYELPHVDPTPTPGVGYCRDLGSGGGGQDPWLGLPIIRVGPATCATLQEIDIDLSEIPIIGTLIPRIYFPGISICMSPVEFGNLEFLGVSVQLDLLAAVLAGVIAIRIFTRS